MAINGSHQVIHRLREVAYDRKTTGASQMTLEKLGARRVDVLAREHAGSGAALQLLQQRGFLGGTDFRLGAVGGSLIWWVGHRLPTVASVWK